MSIPSERMFESTTEVIAWAREEARRRRDIDANRCLAKAHTLIMKFLELSDDSDEKWQT